MRTALVIMSVLALCAIPLAGWAVPTAQVSVPQAGSHFYWLTFSDVDGAQTSSAPVSFRDKQSTIELPVVKDKVAPSTLYVLDGATGNEAVLRIDGKSDKPYKFDLKKTDFDHVREVTLSVVSSKSGLPAAAALVKLEDAGKTARTAVVATSSAPGTARFNDVPAGSAKVTVEYGDGKSMTQDIEISSDHKGTALTIEVPIVGELETVAAPIASTGTESGAPHAAGGPARAGHPAPASRGVDMLSALFGLILLAGIGYGVYRLMRNRGATARQLLQKAGIDLPNMAPESVPASAPQSVQVDPTVCPFCGGKKDPATGGCACAVGGGAPSAPRSSGGEPRLIASGGVYSGGIYQLSSDVLTIGRDETNGIAFPQDSTVSRRHASVMRSNGEYSVRDEGSSNGTFVNGMKITQQTLHPGDEIQIGGTRLRFDL